MNLYILRKVHLTETKSKDTVFLTMHEALKQAKRTTEHEALAVIIVEAQTTFTIEDFPLVETMISDGVTYKNVEEFGKMNIVYKRP